MNQNHNMFPYKILLLAVILVLGGFSGTAAAAGFALIEQSGSGMGNAFAGGAAAVDDASVQFFNPAAITELKGTQFSVAAHSVMPSAKLTDANARETTLGNIPYTTPGAAEDGGVNAIVPNLYFVSDINPQTKFGLSISVPFGLSTDYSNDWIGRYHGIKSSVETININPVLAFKLNDRLSLGGGISAQHISAELTSAIDSGAICYARVLQLGGNPAVSCAPAGLTPGNNATDSYAKIKGDDWGYGFNLGLLYKPVDGARIGVAYRSSVKQSIEGDATFTRSAAFNAFLTGAGSTLFTNTSDSADINLPATLSVSAAHALNTQLELMGDITWTQWNKFKELRVKYGNPAQPDSVTTESWRNTLRYSAGLTYKLDDRMKLRGGVAYDQTPVPDDEHRTVRLPDNNRTWIALGMTYAASSQLSFDVGYSHLFLKDSHINSTTEASVAQNLQGTYKNNIDLLSAQVNYMF
ncbi:OmpP1/FadL family transporter [Sulfuricaulis sp.]|jgi:long-chain fatty acid transport protein|uniref:OmpP1/FadL family transporter n=1 Tax=Sulfuricaulis sp. TaxID=2003553 RepID=UPI00355A01D1